MAAQGAAASQIPSPGPSIKSPWHAAHRRQTYPQLDGLFDHEVAVLEYPRAMATIHSMLAEVGGEERRQLVVCDTKGTIEILPLEPARVRLCLKEPAGGYQTGWQDVGLALPSGRYDDLMMDFAGMVSGQSSMVPIFTPAHDLLVLETLLAVSALPSPARSRT